jgi:hypothetical protein
VGEVLGGRYELGEPVGVEATQVGECDAEGASRYVAEVVDGVPRYVCRCLVCSRCGRHTGNTTQGHWWAWCKATREMREFHFCCPDRCELDR